MASVNMTLILQLKDKLFNKKLSKVRGNIGKLKAQHNEAFSAMRSQVPMLGRGLDLLTNKYVLMGAAIVGIGLLSFSATKKAAAFNREFLNITQMNLSKPRAEMDAYKNTIRNTAFTVGTDLVDTTKAFYDLQSGLGVFGKDAKSIFTDVAKYSQATGADLGSTINSTIKSMKAFNLTSKDTNMLLEANAKAVYSGLVTFDELAKVQTIYAGTAGNINQTVNSANKLYAAFTSLGENANTSATLTKTFFEGLGREAGKIKKFAHVDVFQNGKMRQADDIVKDLIKSFKNMSPEAVNDIISKIGGTEGLRAMLGKAKGNAEDLLKTFDTYDASKFDLSIALKNAQGDVTVLGNIVKNRWNTVLATMGEYLLPLVAWGFNLFNKFLLGSVKALKAVVKWSTEYSDVLIALGAVMVTATAVIYGKAAAIAVWKAVTTGAAFLTDAWTTAQIAFNIAMDANPIGAIIIGVVALVAIITIAIKRYNEFGAALLMLTGGVGVIVNLFLTIKRYWNSIVDAFKSDGLKEGFKQIGRAILDFILYPLQQMLTLLGKIPGLTIAADGAKKIAEWRKKLDMIDPKKSKEKADSSEGLVDENGNFNPDDIKVPTLDQTLGDQVTKVTGAGSQVRNITVNIDALNKGGINTQNTTLANMSTEEIERWFNETMLRVVRNTELSMG